MKSIIVYSGKGGVGKTTTSANIAKTLAAMGYKVFVIDADINTPSMGVIFKTPHPAENIWVASTSFSHKGLIYMEKSLVRQFLRKAMNEINEIKPDYVIIDTPPSITDVHINLIETLAVSEILIVTQPSELSKTDVTRTALFFTDRLPDAGVVIIENMVNEKDVAGTYNWELIARIPFEPSFNGETVLENHQVLYDTIVDKLENMNIADVQFKARKKMMFDETITYQDLPLNEYNMSWKDIKFVNINTWEAVRQKLMDMSSYMGSPDKALFELTTERVERLVKAFEFDDEAYFMITKAPNTSISLLAGEIGKASLFMADSYYGIPRIKYQTREGEVVLLPYEVMPASEKEIRIALEDGSKLTSDGRYIPSKETLEEVYNAYGHRVGMFANWEDIYESIVNNKKESDKNFMTANFDGTHKAKNKQKRRETATNEFKQRTETIGEEDYDMSKFPDPSKL